MATRNKTGGRLAVATPHAPRPGGSYSQGVVANGMLYIAGQVPSDPESGTVPTGLGDQVRRVLDNLEAIARAAGTSLEQAVRVGVYLTDMDRFQEMDVVYREYFGDLPPVRTTVGVALRGFDVEMDAIVALDGGA
jgi:2-iminobutanoate/2-iminopropanoate deaminase